MKFDPMTRVKLEVQRDPVPGVEYVNRIANPSGNLGAWGWVSPDGSTARIDYTTAYGGNPALRCVTAAGAPNLFAAAAIRVAPGEQLRAQWDLLDAPVAGYVAGFKWYSAAGAPLGQGANNITIPSTNYWTSAHVAPAGTGFALFFLQVTKADFTLPYPTAGSFFAVRNVRVFSSTMGSLSDTAMLANAAAPTEYWTNVLGSTQQIDTTRDEFDLGTMTATILNSALDPNTINTLRPGRKIRLTALTGPTSGAFSPLFTGTIRSASVEYDVPRLPASDPRHARITVTAVDAMAALASRSCTPGVDGVSELPALLEAGDFPYSAVEVPWDCDGIAGQVGAVTVTSRNANATVADQVALTRDGKFGYAWIDRLGVLRVRTVLPALTDVVLTESVYSSIDLSFDPTRIINSVGLRVLYYNSGTGVTTEVTSTPAFDTQSVQTWGRYHRDFTITNTNFIAGGSNFAGAVFAANANPTIAPTGVTIGIDTDAHRVASAFLDLYQLAQVKNTAKGVDKQMRITSIRHRITAGQTLADSRWTVQLGLAGNAMITIPQRQPSL